MLGISGIPGSPPGRGLVELPGAPGAANSAPRGIRGEKLQELPRMGFQEPEQGHNSWKNNRENWGKLFGKKFGGFEEKLAEKSGKFGKKSGKFGVKLG